MCNGWSGRWLAPFGACFLGGIVLVSAEAPERVDFNAQIRPLFSDRCFKCHGPDGNAREAGLRLDMPESAYSILDERMELRAIAPGDLEKSEVFRRITADDPRDVMPPPRSNLTLTPDEIELVRLWILQGAEYKEHWAFIAVENVPVPELETRWARNPIDDFVLERLQREGLKPSPEAGSETLIRRVTFDLTGLPPRAEEIEAFVSDSSADAYERLVERLLASPAYGERMAVEWLDLARYADTYGYQADVDRDMSPWRDWVIDAFNENLSYDQFVTWQVAGDLLPEATDEQVLATAFNRLHRMTNEGGSIEEEFRTEYVADRVHTFGTAFLGLTLDCARCHDHKYDPISQKDYFRMFAFFNNIDESGLYSHFTMAVPAPTLLLYGEGKKKEEHARLKQQIAAREKELEEIASAARERFKDWLETTDGFDVIPQPAAAFDFQQIDGNQTPDRVVERHAQLVESPEQVEGRAGKALRFDGEDSVVCRGVGEFNRTDPFSIGLWLMPAERPERAVVFHRSRAWTDSGSRGYELVLEDGRPFFGLVHFWPGNAIAIRAKEALPMDEWSHLTVTYDGSSRASGMRIYRNGRPVEHEVVRDHLFKDILHRKEWGDMDVGNIHLTLAARFRDAGFRNGLIEDVQVFERWLSPLEVGAVAGENVAGAGLEEPDGVNRVGGECGQECRQECPPYEEAELFTFYLHRYDEPFKSAMDELRQLRVAENDFVNDMPEIMVMREMAERRPTFVLERGAYDSPAESVEPGTPESILPFPAGLPKDRLGLARWTVDRRNPLTARVAVNRIWQMHFGRGLVSTSEDFGSQSELPSHPELLDWLAHRFMESGWDVKALHRLIVTSATYRQSSIAVPQLVERDPDNLLLARGPKHRLQAEQIRDAALAVSGLLSPRMGGPSARPYQPEGLWEQSGIAKTYVQDTGEGLYRRSLYTFWRRTAPPPSMLSFDAVTREICTAKREVTATPLQALVLLNDPQFVESARVFAERLLRQSGEDLEGRIEEAFLTILGRRPHAREREIVGRLYAEQYEFFSADPAAAEDFLGTGESPRDPELAVEKLAATAVLAGALMNHDEFVMKR